MAISLGNLDPLLGLSLPASDLTDAAIQSSTDIPGPNMGLATITATTTGAPSALTGGATELTITGIDDLDNTLTVQLTGNGIDQTETLYAAGFAANTLFLSTEQLTQLYLVIASQSGATNPDFGILTETPPPPSPDTFNVYGTADLTPGPLGTLAAGPPVPFTIAEATPDDLLTLFDIKFAAADFTAVTLQSTTTSTTAPLGASSFTVTDTGQPAPGFDSATVIRAGGVTTDDNAISFNIDAQTENWAVVGYSAGALLLAELPTTSGSLTPPSPEIGSTTMAVLDFTPPSAGTAETFTTTGAATMTAPTLALCVIDPGTSTALAATSQTYTGPVAGLAEQYAAPAGNGLDIVVTTPDWFIVTGGEQAVSAASGDNVLDGAGNSAFLSGGTGTDTFFLDYTAATGDIWSTLLNFHAGDTATLWGVNPSQATLTWLNNAGAPGYTGLTLTISEPGHPDASMTFAGYTTQNLSNGTLNVTSGTDTASGRAYLSIAATG